MQARGSAESDEGFQTTLDELHELIEKFSATHKIILGGDFNASLHRVQSIRRDTMLKKFLQEHNLRTPDHYPIQPTYWHEGTEASSQIDYWFLSEIASEKMIIAKPNRLNLSDHVEVALSIQDGITEICILTPKEVETPSCIKPKIRWEKSDPDLYRDILETNLTPMENSHPACRLDVDIMVSSLNSVLYRASVAATPKGRPQKKPRKRTLPLWNDEIASAVEQSKQAHKQWQLMGRSTDNGKPYVRQRKQARRQMRLNRRQMRRTIREQIYLDKQDKYEKLMDAKETDTKVFYSLVAQQRSTKSTDTKVLHYNGNTYTEVESIADAFSEHFRQLATPQKIRISTKSMKFKTSLINFL